jgi:uncharacterized protein DUF87
MKLYTRVLLAAGCIEYGVFAILCLVGFAWHPLSYGIAGAWLAIARWPVRRFFLPPLFPGTTCPNCRLRISLRARMKCGSHWIDHCERHALAVYCNHGHEVGTFRCPNEECGATIQLQKGDRKLLNDWTLIESQSLVASDVSSAGDSLRIGIQQHSVAVGWRRIARRWLRRPLGEPAYLSYDTLGKHGAVFGATGMGKSTLLISFARQVFEAGDGASVLDPAGDLARALLQHVPRERVDDVLYLNVADQKFPFPFNILHAHDANERNLLPDEIIGIFKRLYAREWGGTLAHQLRMAINVALEIGGSFADVYDLFTSPEARRRIVRRVRDRELRHYWEETFPSSSLPSRMSIINKLTPIVKHPFLGPILCSRECIVDADDIIGKKRILIVSLATGTRADHTTTILGTFIVNKIIAAAYRQSQIADPSRRVRHFFFVDEFQNFMHQSFDWSTGLSELRKYKMSLLLVTQFVDALSETIRASIFGNVAFLAAFRIGHRDAAVLKEEFDGATKRSLMNQIPGECHVRIGTHALSLRTDLPPVPNHDPTDRIVARMRTTIVAMREDIEDGVTTQGNAELASGEQAVAPLVLCEFA